MHDDDKIPLGEKVKDRLSGFSGILIGRSEFLYANDTVLVHSEELLDGKPLGAVWFDSARIQRAEVAAPAPFPVAQKEAE